MSSTRKGNRYIFFILLFYILGSISLEIIVSPYQESLTPLQSVLINTLIGQIGFIFLPLIGYLFITKRSFVEVLKLRKLPIFSVLLVVLIGFMMQPITYFINILSQLYSSNMIGNYLLEVSSLPYWLLLLCFALVPAINEELTMRGLLLYHYKHVSPIKAALVSGLFFGILHLNLNQFTYAFFMGFVFGLVVWITDSIFSSMLLHFIINGTSVSLLKVLTYIQTHFSNLLDGNTLENQSLSQSDLLAMLIPAIFIAVPFIFIVYALIYLLAKEHGKLAHFVKKKSEDTDGVSPFESQYKRIIDPYFILIVVAFVGITVLQYV